MLVNHYANRTLIVSCILSTKRNAMFLFAFFFFWGGGGVKFIDFKNNFISAVLPCYKYLDCIVPS